MIYLEDFIEIKSEDDIKGIALTIEGYFLEKYSKNIIFKQINDSIFIENKCFDIISFQIAKKIYFKLALQIVQDLLEEDYGELSNEEIYNIYAFLQRKLNQEETVSQIQEIDKKLHFFAQNFKKINLDSFLFFSLNNIMNDELAIFEKYVDEFLTEEELLEFSYILKSYVETEPYKIDELNIIIDLNGGYKYFNKNKCDITPICHLEFYEEFYDSAASEDEILISVLMMKLPKQIIIHKLCDSNNANLLIMLKNIFGERLKICLNECNFCKS